MQKPNVVIITPDELRADYVSCLRKLLPSERSEHGASAQVETSHIDSLATQGTLFTQAFVQHGKCTPSRTSMFTGQYASTGGHRTLHLKLRPGERHLAETFRANGYTTALVGRNHIVEDDHMVDSFDHWIHEPVDEPTDHAESIGDPLTGAYYRGRVLVDLADTTDGRNTAATLSWLREVSSPFFLWFNLYYPHPPYQVPEPYFSLVDRRQVRLYPEADFADKPNAMSLMYKNYGLDRLTDNDWREIMAVYGGMVAAVDDMVGQLLQALEDRDLSKNTVVVFTTDHGDYAGQYQLVEKWDCLFHDCILQTPLILKVPWIKAPACRVDSLVELVDLAPTLYELCDLSPPPGMAGKSLMPILHDHEHTHRESVYAEGGREQELLEKDNPYLYSRGRPMAYSAKYKVFYDDPQTLARAAMVRTKQFKLISRLNGRSELYDLRNDPEEMVNVHGKPGYAEAEREMERLLIERLLEAQPRLPPVDRPGV
jgi:arylsulfatase A-like enzyme